MWTEIFNHCFNGKTRILLLSLSGHQCWLLPTRIGNGSWFGFWGATPRPCSCLNRPSPREGGEVINTTKTQREERNSMFFLWYSRKFPCPEKVEGGKWQAEKTLQSPTSREQETEICQALSNPVAKMSFWWQSGWVSAAAANTVLAVKSPQDFAPAHDVCTHNRRMGTPAVCYGACSGCCGKEHVGNRNFFRRAKSPSAFPNPFFSIKLSLEGTLSRI